ncbi:hypothetical protein ABUW04_14195 [Streptacidiphilus sp. N1-10]|uniref:Uncharacterized protein n=1 Tax=Streptacidiphilus jeojiensis TaxID=3229225 RepID=A0ABV6XMD7_9ACTN
MTDPGKPHDPDRPEDERPVERLLRAALGERAAQVGPNDLRPAAPPATTVRRTRHLYTITLPLVGLAAAGMIGYFSFDGVRTSADHTVGPAVSASTAPSPRPSPPASPSDSPSPSLSSSPSQPSSTSPSAPGSSSPASTGPGASASAPATSTPTTGADAASGQYVAAAWLQPSEYPLDTQFRWKPSGGATPSNTTGAFQWLYTCGSGDPTTELGTESISTLDFNASSFTGSSAPQAAQVTFYFKDAGTAAAALDAVQHDYTDCASRLSARGQTDMTSGRKLVFQVTRTATGASGFGYRFVARDTAGKPADMPDLPADAQELFARSGNVLTMVDIQGSGDQLDPSTDAARVLAAMATRLGAYPR